MYDNDVKDFGRRFMQLKNNESFSDVTLVLEVGEDQDMAGELDIPVPTLGGEEGKREKEEPGDTIQAGHEVPRSTYRLHRGILSARSTHFQSMFSLGLKETDLKEIVIHDADPAIFAKVHLRVFSLALYSIHSCKGH